jgi:hypothetical protein
MKRRLGPPIAGQFLLAFGHPSTTEVERKFPADAKTENRLPSAAGPPCRWELTMSKGGSAISVATERAAGLVQRPLKENACTAFLGRMRGLYGRHEALCAADFSPKVLEPATVPEGQSYAARSFG